MTREELRWGAHIAIQRLEWIDKHIDARADKYLVRLLREMEDLEDYLEKVVEED